MNHPDPRPTRTPFRAPVQIPFSRTAPDCPLQNLGEKLAGLTIPTAPAKPSHDPAINRQPRRT